jgi:DNA/RNA endonuclease YhcR with UshA esterase domain
MKTILSIFIASAFAITLPAADTNAPAGTGAAALVKIGALQATNYYDQMMIVTGKVVQITIRPSVTFLNLDQPFPDSPFAIVIIHGKSSYYGDANALKGKSIEIHGKIKNYHDKPEIVLDSTNQLTVLDFTNAVNPAIAPPISSPAKTPPAVPSTNGIPEIM